VLTGLNCSYMWHSGKTRQLYSTCVCVYRCWSDGEPFAKLCKIGWPGVWTSDFLYTKPTC